MPPAGRLPFVDELSVEVAAGPGATWEAVLDVVERTMSNPRAARGARLLGCADTEAAGPRPIAAGSTVPGFQVESARPPLLLDLAGSHRFSRYALSFRLDQLGPDRTRVRAETRALFPGLRGGLYRALVIGTRGHVLVTGRLLGAIRRRAERA